MGAFEVKTIPVFRFRRRESMLTREGGIRCSSSINEDGRVCVKALSERLVHLDRDAHLHPENSRDKYTVEKKTRPWFS